MKKKGQATKRTEKTCQLLRYPVSQRATVAYLKKNKFHKHYQDELYRRF